MMAEDSIMSGGQSGLRGYLLQTIIALFDAIRTDPPWTAIEIEPDTSEEKTDFITSCRAEPQEPVPGTTWRLTVNRGDWLYLTLIPLGFLLGAVGGVAAAYAYLDTMPYPDFGGCPSGQPRGGVGTLNPF
jgi:hypothetical protein